MTIDGRMRVGIALVLMSSVLASPATARAQAEAAATLAGTAQTAGGQTVANIAVQLRDLATGQLTATTTSSATGTFAFGGLAAGNYTVEVVNAAGQILGSSAAIPVAAGAAVSGVTVTASAAIAAASVAGAAAAGAVSGIGAAVIVTTAATGAGIAALVPVVPDVSPSR